MTDHRHERKHAHERRLGLTARALGDFAVRLHHQPSGAEQGVAHRHPQAAQQGERGCPIEWSAGEDAVLHFDALDDAAEDHALTNGGNRRTAGEGNVPVALARHRDRAKFECDAAKNQRQQHDEDRKVQGGHDDRVGLRKRHPQSASAQDQPGLVAVPERRNRVHHLVALALGLREWKQNAGAEVETVEDDIERDRRADDPGPDHRKVGFHGFPRVTVAGTRFRARRRWRLTTAGPACRYGAALPPALAVPARSAG